MEPLFEYSRPGFSLTVYQNRIETSTGSLFKKKDAILLRNITEVSLTKTNRLQIHTSDGKRLEYVLGTQGEQARQAIMQALP